MNVRQHTERNLITCALSTYAYLNSIEESDLIYRNSESSFDNYSSRMITSSDLDNNVILIWANSVNNDLVLEENILL